MARRKTSPFFSPPKSRSRRRKSTSADDALKLIAILVLLTISGGLLKIIEESAVPIISFVFRVLLIFAFACGIVFWIRREKAKKVKAALLEMGASNPMQLSPQQYERFCGALLEQNGWKVQYTKRTGDQGADIIAEKPGQRIVVQCKQWSSSVGVHAVQEIHAACSYYRAHKGIVVSTTDYTSGAKELARRVGVTLLGHQDLIAL